MPYYNRDPKRDHNFDNHPYDWGSCEVGLFFLKAWGLGFRVSKHPSPHKMGLELNIGSPRDWDCQASGPKA